MTRKIAFAEGMGTGAGLFLFLVALLVLSKSRPFSAIAGRIDQAARTGRSPWTGEPPSNLLDVCRCAGL